MLYLRANGATGLKKVKIVFVNGQVNVHKHGMILFFKSDIFSNTDKMKTGTQIQSPLQDCIFQIL